MIIPVDRIINSKRMLESNEFQTRHFHNDEMLWLITYLRKVKKLDEQSIFAKWVPFYLKKEGVTPEYARDVFKPFWDRSKTFYLRANYKEAAINQKEISYINSLPIPKWVKQYFFMLLIHTRVTDNIYYDSLPFEEYHWYLDTTNHNYDDMKKTIMKYANEYGFVKNIKIKEVYDTLDDVTDDGWQIASDYGQKVIYVDKFEICSPAYDESEEFDYIYESILDALEDMNDLIHNRSICSKCGKEFAFNPKSKRHVCDECWKQERQAIKNKYRDEWRKRKTGN